MARNNKNIPAAPLVTLKDRLYAAFQSLSLAMSANDIERFRRLFANLHPHDRAHYFFNAKPKIRARLYGYLTPTETAEIFEHAEIKNRGSYITEMKPEYAADMLAAMHGDDAVDILNELDERQMSHYFTLMDDESEQRLRELSKHKEGTAGSIMTTDLVSIYETDTAEEAIHKLIYKADVAATIYYAFVIDKRHELTGVVSLRTLLSADKQTVVGDLQDINVISISADAHRVKAAKLIKDYNFLALPVVNDHNKLLGIITVDDVVDVLHEEAVDDYSKFAAIADTELSSNPFVNVRKRLPWLSILLFLGLLTATLISQFEDVIAQVAILGAFIPVVSGTTGNSGTQALAVVVRALATGDFEKISIKRHFLTEAATALMTSIICGFILFCIIYIWKSEPFVGLVAGGSLSVSIFAGTLSGSFVPLVLHKIGVDPAVASGPLITTICDILSMFVYFTMATALMVHLL